MEIKTKFSQKTKNSMRAMGNKLKKLQFLSNLFYLVCNRKPYAHDTASR
jgi:hypothetical protein